MLATTIPTQKLLHVISLGAGVQSSAMALMAALGEITPMPLCAVFADTQAEPASVYEWLDWLRKELPFPVHRVTRGSLREQALRVRTSEAGNKYLKHGIPVFVDDGSGKVGTFMRHCTLDFKIEVITRKLAEIRRAMGKRHVVQWVGISWEEKHRMKLSRLSYITNTWPLVERHITRQKCLEWMREHGFPEPPRSACDMCPYHSDKEWKRLRDDEPQAFQNAVEFETRYQDSWRQVDQMRGVPYLHRSLVPLSEVNFDQQNNGQIDLFGNECEGLCGV